MNTKKILALCALLALLLTTVQAQTSWKGTSSTAWSTAANWTAGVPTSALDATIGDTNFAGPNHSGSSGACRSLMLGTGSIASTPTVNTAISVNGNLSPKLSLLAHKGRTAL